MNDILMEMCLIRDIHSFCGGKEYDHLGTIKAGTRMLVVDDVDNDECYFIKEPEPYTGMTLFKYRFIKASSIIIPEEGLFEI